MAEVNDPYYNYLQKTSNVESSGNPYAKAKTSSASGLYQFTDSTWKGVVNKHNLGYTLNDRFNPEKSEKVMRLFTQDNEKQLKPIVGRELTDSERYLGHFLGIKGAGNLFKAYKKDENMPVDYYVSPKALQANKGVFYNKDGSIKTTKQVYDWANKKMGDSSTYTNSVAPYINQNIDFSNNAEGITFEEEKPEKETETTQALKVLQERQKEEDFLTELFSGQEQKIAELYKPIEEEQGSQPQSYDYNDIRNFVESPILAQQGKTMYVKSVNDPRYKAYQDSLTIYNSYARNPTDKWLKSVKKDSKGQVSEKDWEEFSNRGLTNKTQMKRDWDAFNSLTKLNGKEPGKKLPFKQALGNDSFNTYVSVFKKPTQPVQVRPNVFKDDRGNIVTTGDNKPTGRPQLVQVLQKLEDRPDINPIQSNLKPQGVETDFELRTDIDIRAPYRNPKYYDIEDYIQGSTNYTGSQTNYRTSDLSQLTQLSANNTRKIIPQYEYGGGIKIDNQGYWNPQNWGKPVQINSNNITMEGVNQPLMGYAPETGEKRLMMPNTNHIFNGAKRVIESPLTEKEKQFLKEITKIK